MTYSLIGRDPGSGEIGVAVQSQAFNTGAAVPWARPGVGAVATQSFTDRRYGWRGLELLTHGIEPADALAQLRDGDELIEFRQVGVMAAGGDWRGRGGAAIVVVPSDGEPWERVIDLRVEEGDGSLVELRRLLERALGYRAANRADTDREQIGLRYDLPSTHVRWLAIEDALDRGDAAGARALYAALEHEQPRWRDFAKAVMLVPGSEHFGDLLAD